MSTPLTLGAAGVLAGLAALSRARGSQAERYVEVSSMLFRGSGVNATSMETARSYAAQMERYGGWGAFPAIHGVLMQIDQADLEEYQEAEEGGYAHELDYSRPLTEADLGREYVSIEDGHHRAIAAAMLGISLHLKEWEEVK